MERLTIKYKDGSYGHITGSDWYNFEDDYDKLFNKLGSLEDLQDELGIPLEVLFKALKNGFYVRFVGLPARRLPEYSRFDFYNKKIDECNLKDYGKTWALTREELEND